MAFEKRPKNVGQLQRLLFGDDMLYPCPWSDETWETDRIAQIVWDDMKGKKKMTEDQILLDLCGGFMSFTPEWDDFEDEEGKVDWEAYQKAYEIAARKYWKEWSEEHSLDKHMMFCFSYADEDGSMFGAMEHGGLFDSLPHITISYH